MAAPQQSTSSASPAARILIVDDERHNRQVLELMLSAEGYDLLTAASGEEALALAMVAGHGPDLVLLDVMMPGMDGHEVAARIKGNAATRNIPIIMVSALNDRNNKIRGLQAGAEDFLSKPVDRLELCIRVKNLLSLKAYADEHDKSNQVLAVEVRSRTVDLLESERLYRSTFDAAPVGIVHVGLNGQWLRVNERVCQLLGYSRWELESIAVLDIMQPEDVALETESFRRMAGGTLDRDVVDQKCYRRRDGTLVWARVNTSVHRDAAGRAQHFISVIEEITERRALEAEVYRSVARLTASEERYRTLLENANDAIAVLTPGGIVREMNHRWLEITGREREDLIGRHVRDLAPRGKEDETAAMYSHVMATHGGQMTSVEIAAKPGATVIMEFSRAAIDLGGERLVLTIGRDVTQQRMLETQLRQAQKLEVIGRLAAGVAHEINTPVQFIGDSMAFIRDALGNLTPLIRKYQSLRLAAHREAALRALAEETARDEEELDLEYTLENVPRALERSIDGLSRVTTIVRSMNSFAHPDGKEMVAVDLNQAIRATLVICRHEYKMIAELETDFQPLPPVRCHPGEVNQVIVNIVVNAAHAIEDVVKVAGGRGVIRVGTVREGDDVLVSIADTGSGMADAIRDHIFEPFFTTKEVGKGTGQGLSVARAVVDKHGGKLTCDSAPGSGTTFHIRLPIDRDGKMLPA